MKMLEKKLKSHTTKEDLHYYNQNINEIKVCEIEKELARQYISTFHYSKVFPDSTLFAYGAYLGNQLVGVVCYGMGCNKEQYTYIVPFIENGQYCELTRLWVLNELPKNSESIIISKSLKLLPNKIKLVLSYADNGKGHCGIIYQATNWYYTGKSETNKMLVDEKGKKIHTRLISIYRKRHEELKDIPREELIKKFGWKYDDGSFKYRYVKLRGSKVEKKRMFKCFENMIQPYPKLEHKNDEISDIDIYDKDLEKYKLCKQLDLFD